MKRLGVVIPVRNLDLFYPLALQIRQNIARPEICIFIDNTIRSESLDPYIINEYIGSGIEAQVVSSYPRMGVNESWEIGARLCGDVDYVSILNDDIEIKPDFFERILLAFDHIEITTDGNEKAAAICPWTYTSNAKENPIEASIIRMKRVEGWAFTIRKEILNGSFPMPSGMKTFAGDNWLWWMSYRKFVMYWYKDTENRIFHNVGSSMTKEIRNTLKQEKDICSQKLKEVLGNRYGKLRNVPMEIFT